MFFVHPNDTERHSLRLLLLYRKGCDSFKLLRTVDNVIYETYKETLFALGLTDDDKEWDLCLNEASFVSSAQQLRELFVMIILNCTPSDPASLWHKYKSFMAEDVLYEFRNKFKNNNIYLNNETFSEMIFNITLQRIDFLLKKNGKLLNDIPNMPKFNYTNDDLLNQPNLINEEYAYDFEKLKQLLINDLPKMNIEQKIAFDTIIHRTNYSEKGMFN